MPLPSVAAMGRTQAWELTIDGRRHRVETSDGAYARNTATWFVDGFEVAQRSSMDDHVELSLPEEHLWADEVGSVRVRWSALATPRRVTWFDGDRGTSSTKAAIGVGGIDLDPEAGSPAAEREDRARTRPELYASRHVAGGVGKVLVPLLLAAAVAWIIKRLPKPDWDLPSIPWPDLPSIPWPDLDLPSIPWPDIDLPGLPEWLRSVLGLLKYVWPILLGCYLARREIVRRREQDEIKERMRSGSHPGSGSPEPREHARP